MRKLGLEAHKNTTHTQLDLKVSMDKFFSFKRLKQLIDLIKKKRFFGPNVVL